jgi:hypothetical protein
MRKRPAAPGGMPRVPEGESNSVSGDPYGTRTRVFAVREPFRFVFERNWTIMYVDILTLIWYICPHPSNHVRGRILGKNLGRFFGVLACRKS